MSVRIGNTDITKIPIGDTLVSKVYVGEQRILPVPPIDTYIENIVKLGGNENAVKDGYSNVPYPIKDKASVILFPSYVDKYRAYAMDNNTGDVLPVYFSRNSQATLFDSDLNMQLTESNMPRIDYGNYSEEAKILIEKESTNIIRDSGYELDLDNYLIGDYSKENFDWKGSLLSNVAYRLGGAHTASSAVYKRFPLNIDYVFSLSVFVTKDNDTPLIKYLGYNTTDVHGGFSANGFIAYESGYPYLALTVFQKGNTIRNYAIGKGSINVPNNPNGIAKGTNNLRDDIYLSGYQAELGTVCTSYIPTTDSMVTRSADIMKINLLKDCQVYIKTTKEEKYLDKTAGVWNVQDDITESDGLLVLAIMEDGAFDKDFFNNQFVKGHPKMTSNNTPSPYITYSNSVYSSTFAAWCAFNERDTSQSGWTSGNSQFNADGTAVGTMPYLYLNTGNSSNAKKFCMVKLKVRSADVNTTYPRVITIGYSPANNNDYTYQRIYGLTPEVWSANNYEITIYFEPPATPMQHWSLTVRENNGHERTQITDVQFFEDINK